MIEWIKKNSTFLITGLVTIGVLLYCYGCEPKVPSLNNTHELVNRQELQLELNHIISMAQLRMVDLEKQEQLRTIILQNALVLVEGQPFNPVGIVSAVAAIYGIASGSQNITRVVKNKTLKRKAENGTG